MVCAKGFEPRNAQWAFTVDTREPSIVKLGVREGIRTPDLWYRKPTLYPAELRAQSMYGVRCHVARSYKSAGKA